MDVTTVQAEPRQHQGRHANERLRRRGMVPAIVYGHGEPPEMIALSAHDVEIALAQLAHVINVQIDGRPRQLLIKDVQYDHLNSTPLHLDLMRVDLTEAVHVKVRVEMRGDAKGVKDGGMLEQVINDLDIECRLTEIPEVIRVNVAGLELGQALHVRELDLPANVKALHKPDDVVAVVRLPKTEAAESPAAAPVAGEAAKEPEVIGRKAREEGAGEDGA